MNFLSAATALGLGLKFIPTCVTYFFIRSDEKFLFFRPVKAIVRTDEANSMAFLQREFLPSNDTYKTKTSAGKTLKFICGNENVTHSAQGETVFFGGNFLFRISEYTQRERECSFRKLQIFISQTTDFHYANYRFPFRKVQISSSQSTDFHFAKYRFPFRKLQISISISFRPISFRKLQ